MKNSKNLLLDQSGQKVKSFERIHITSGSQFDEKWLQNVIFNNIELLEIIDPAFEKLKLIWVVTASTAKSIGITRLCGNIIIFPDQEYMPII